MSTVVLGTRLPDMDWEDCPSDSSLIFKDSPPGSYCKVYTPDGSYQVHFVAPNGTPGGAVSPELWDITENEYGELTIRPAILTFTWDNEPMTAYNGYLTEGVWHEC